MRLEKIINTAYSFGAAVVVFGAWAKLVHKDYSEIALTTGLLTETTIFCIYGLLEWRRHTEPLALPPADQPYPPADQPSPAGYNPPPAVAADTSELTDTLKQTNRILYKIFKTE